MAIPLEVDVNCIFPSSTVKLRFCNIHTTISKVEFFTIKDFWIWRNNIRSFSCGANTFIPSTQFCIVNHSNHQMRFSYGVSQKNSPPFEIFTFTIESNDKTFYFLKSYLKLK